MSTLTVDSNHLSRPPSDLNAEHYVQCSQLQNGLAETILSRVDGLATKVRAYDIGCGDGSITAVLAGRMPNGKVTGIDISPNMIEYANRKFSRAGGKLNIDFCVQDVEHFLPVGNAPDLITSFSAFHWVRKPEETLRNLCKFITPGGDLLILTYVNSNYYQFLQNTLQKHYPEFQAQSAYCTMFSTEGYQRVLTECGMKIEEFNVEHLIASQKNEQAVKNFIGGWLTSFVPLPQKEHENFLNLAIEESRKYRLPSDDETIRLPFTKVTIRAKKSVRVHGGGG